MRQFIVAEVSKTWVDGRSHLVANIGELFQLCIQRNLDRGYRLHSFDLNQVATQVEIAAENNRIIEVPSLVETIIAVFEQFTPTDLGRQLEGDEMAATRIGWDADGVRTVNGVRVASSPLPGDKCLDCGVTFPTPHNEGCVHAQMPRTRLVTLTEEEAEAIAAPRRLCPHGKDIAQFGPCAWCAMGSGAQ